MLLNQSYKFDNCNCKKINMRTTLLKATAILSIAGLMSTLQVSAQDNAAQIVKSGAGTVNDLANVYMGPLMKGFGLGLADGWNNNTARTLGTGGFDLRFNLGVCMVPTNDQSYNPNEVFKSNSNITWVNNGVGGSAPSMFGTSGQPLGTMDGYGKVRLTNPITNLPFDTTLLVTKMQLPPGGGVPYSVTMPSVQLSVGIYKNTEVMIRFVPQIAAGTFKVGTWGVGVKHSIKQWIPVIKDQKIWDWSALASYSQFTSEFGFGTNSLKPDSGSFNPNPSIDYTNQKITMTGNGFTIGTLVSAKLLFFTPYVGFNYSYSSMNMKFEGNFPVPVPDEKYQPVSILPNYHPFQTKISNLADPINVDGSISNVRVNMGARIKLAVLIIGGEYSIGTYNTATLSVGLNLQSIKPFKL